MNPLGKCPKCKKSWKGKAIPKKYSGFGKQTHFSHLISIINRDTDRCVAEECPFCKERFER